MARGWESKSVESQIESANERRGQAKRVVLTPAQAALVREREGLELTRVRVLRDLEAASSPRRREQVEAALRHLDEQIAALNERSGA